MKIDSIKDGDIWKDTDVLIFNTFQWWGRRGPKQQWDCIQEGGKIYTDMDRMVAFRKGLTTWANWVNSAVDTRKTRGFLPRDLYYNGIDWNRPGEKNCAKETQPLKGSVYPGGVHPATITVNEALSTIRKPVHLLDLTTLSQMHIQVFTMASEAWIAHIGSTGIGQERKIVPRRLNHSLPWRCASSNNNSKRSVEYN
ncbi:trichome birefringence-like [Thalictrum thalictroides]|uniref:Trichome birefringence-like n=1 Tax=Thalictrum thalictroides TaxID=46969 RepID=A0A7J6VXG0_THATH|nr:trichome birefringence-like [Thalictrum thalictroides]